MKAHMRAVRQKLQMIGVYAELVAAFMVNIKMLRNVTMLALIGDAVREESLAADGNAAVAATLFDTSPYDAIANRFAIGGKLGFDAVQALQWLQRDSAYLLPIVSAAQALFFDCFLASFKAARHRSSS
jgi:hypothetical protein